MTATSVDKRRGPALFYHLSPDGKMFGPEGKTNTFYDVLGSVKRNGSPPKVEKVGELQLGSDGFLEAMFFLNGKLVKLKLTPGNGLSGDKVYIEGVWG